MLNLLFGLGREFLADPEKRKQRSVYNKLELLANPHVRDYLSALPAGANQAKFYEAISEHRPNLVERIKGQRPSFLLPPVGGELGPEGRYYVPPESGVFFPPEPDKKLLSPEKKTELEDAGKSLGLEGEELAQWVTETAYKTPIPPRIREGRILKKAGEEITRRELKLGVPEATHKDIVESLPYDMRRLVQEMEDKEAERQSLAQQREAYTEELKRRPEKEKKQQEWEEKKFNAQQEDRRAAQRENREIRFEMQARQIDAQRENLRLRLEQAGGGREIASAYRSADSAYSAYTKRIFDEARLHNKKVDAQLKNLSLTDEQRAALEGGYIESPNVLSIDEWLYHPEGENYRKRLEKRGEIIPPPAASPPSHRLPPQLSIGEQHGGFNFPTPWTMGLGKPSLPLTGAAPKVREKQPPSVIKYDAQGNRVQ